MTKTIKLSMFICLAIVTTTSCQVKTTPEASGATRPGSSSDCLAPEDISNTLMLLAESASQAEVVQIRAALVNESKRSTECRSALIESIINTMDSPDALFKDRAKQINLWGEGAWVLGDLKATEALDYLVAHLDFSTGVFSTTMSHKLAFRAIVSIGEPAIPKLKQVLRENNNANVRRDAIYCISAIGGPSALEALKEALPFESDHCVVGFIKASIEALDNEKQKISDTNKWFLAFMCNSKT